MKKQLLPIIILTSLYFSSCGGETTVETDKKDSVVQEKDTTLAEVERYFTVEKISEEDFNKVKFPLATPPNGMEEKEPFYLEKFPKEAKRYDSLTLMIYCRNDKTFELKDNYNEEALEEMRIHSFEGVAGDLALIHLYFYEASGFQFIDLSSGEEHSCIGYPVLSPDGKLLMSASADLGAMFDPNGLQLFEKQGAKWVLKWEVEITHWEPHDVKWENTNTIVLKRAWAPGTAGDPGPDYLRLKLK